MQMVPGVGGQNLPFDPAEAKKQTCICGSEIFDKVFQVGRISKMAPKNRTGIDVAMESPVYVCHKCGVELK